MDEGAFEGTTVLERLAEVGRLDDFMEAVDDDDVGRAVALMRRAGIDDRTIAIVARKMESGDGEH